MSDINRTDPLGATPDANSTVEFTPASPATPAATSFDPAPSTFDDVDASEDTTADETAAKAKGTAKTLKDEAGKLGRQATEQARGLVDEGKARATGALDEFSRMMDDAANTVDEKLGEQYGQYARNAAGAISGFSDSLRDKDVEELIEDVRDFVRKSPAIAIGTAAALGFVLARVVKAGVDAAADAADGTTASTASTAGTTTPNV